VTALKSQTVNYEQQNIPEVYGENASHINDSSERTLHKSPYRH